MNSHDTGYGDARFLLKNVLMSLTEKCKRERNNQALEVPLNEPRGRIAFYAGLSNTTINQLMLNKQTTSLDLKSRVLLHELVKGFYVNRGLIDYDSLYKIAIKGGLCKTNQFADKTISSLDEFIDEMKLLGYERKETIYKTQVIMENPEIRFERFMYLSRMKKIRNNVHWKQLVYIDERIVNNDQTYEKLWLRNSNLELETGDTIFYHAVSKNGYISGLYSNQASYHDFSKWVTDILLGHLRDPSVIIMDSNPLHGVQENACPVTKYHSKQEMLRWLTKNHIPCSSTMNKPELYELIKKCNKDSMHYQIDSIIRSQGHEVMRLPQFYYDLTLTTPLWEYIVANCKIDTSTSVHLLNTLMNFIYSIKPITWMECDNVIEKFERDVFQTDISMDSLIDNFEVII